MQKPPLKGGFCFLNFFSSFIFNPITQVFTIVKTCVESIFLFLLEISRISHELAVGMNGSKQPPDLGPVVVYISKNMYIECGGGYEKSDRGVCLDILTFCPAG